jgi:hypothetical protein
MATAAHDPALLIDEAPLLQAITVAGHLSGATFLTVLAAVLGPVSRRFPSESP